MTGEEAALVRDSEWFVRKATKHRIEVTNDLGSVLVKLSLADGDNPLCTHLHRFYNGSCAGSPDAAADGPEPDYWHACSFDDLVADLVAIQALRSAYLRGEVKVGCAHACAITAPSGAQRCMACGLTRASAADAWADGAAHLTEDGPREEQERE
jgi:hypothetical protein